MVYQKNTFEDGAKYERMMGVWSQLVGTHFLEWLNPTGGLNWIDIGCGSGAFTAQVAEFFSPSHLLGIDPSEAQIEFARNRSIKHPVTFQTGDAMSLQCVDNSMDIATMALVLFLYQIQKCSGRNEESRQILWYHSSLCLGYFWGRYATCAASL